ncbi:spermidine synthase [bacterium]|nr:spermidine synthase [bacterium]
MKSQKRMMVLVYCVFFLSGMAGLIYEISWSRQIGLLFGHTVQAASTVLASYFAGMGLGYLLGGVIAKRVRPLVGYAVAEFVIGAWAIAVPLLIQASESAAFSPWLSAPTWGAQTLLRSAFCFAILLPATISMGVTLPLMAEFLSGGDKGSETVSQIGIAYSLNTLGALTGTVLATFFLLITVGVCGSSFIGVGLSVLCGILALVIARKIPSSASTGSEPRFEKSGEAKGASTWGVLTLAFASGFGTLALQVLYTRMFALVFHNSTYTFGVVVAVFLAALAGGAAAASWLQRLLNAQVLAGISTGVGAILTIGAVIGFAEYTELRYFTSGESFNGYIAGAFLLVTATIGPAIFCLGMLLPLVWSLAGVSESAGSVVGTITSFNTLGAAIGALFASYFMLVYIGLWASIVVIAGMFLLCSLSLLIQLKRTKLAVAFTAAFLVCAVAGLRSPSDAEYSLVKLGEEVVKRFRSPYGWIDVVKLKDSPVYKIRQNLHYRFGRTGSNVREFRQAHIPLFLHPNPHSVLFLGLGTGMTAGGAIPHAELESIEAVELIPEVVDAVKMLSEFNYDIVDHPKTKIHVDDARHFLLSRDRTYDVIVSDLFVPWESESGYLYTVEHYEVSLDRLNEDGIFCQWLPMYQIGAVEFESIANSFAKVFPHTTIWWGQLSNRKPVLALVGSRRRIEIDAGRLATRIESVNANRQAIDPHVSSVKRLWQHYAGDWTPTADSGLNRDEFPRVEFLTPVSNRNRELLSGPNFEHFYETTMQDLPDRDAVLIGGEKSQTTQQIRSRQRLILFGGEK